MERRKFTREFKLEAVRLIQGSRRLVWAGIGRPWGSHVATARLGEEVLRRSRARVSRQRPDEAGAAGDRTAEARSRQAEGGTRHSKKPSRIESACGHRNGCPLLWRW